VIERVSGFGLKRGEPIKKRKKNLFFQKNDGIFYDFFFEVLQLLQVNTFVTY